MEILTPKNFIVLYEETKWIDYTFGLKHIVMAKIEVFAVFGTKELTFPLHFSVLEDIFLFLVLWH